MIYGYARVSTVAQDLTSQLAQLKAAGCARVFREKISGASADRPQLRKLLAAVTHGDVVIIPAVAAAQIMRAAGEPARPARG
jgi:DNA invertase Pin-like site-specific DNA recombinase